MAVVPAQDRLGGHVQDLVAVARAGLVDAGDDPVAFISPDVPSLDFLGAGPRPCANSMLAAYVVSVGREATTPTGQLNSEQQHRWGWLTMAQVQFTYARCITGMSKSGAPPSPDTQTRDSMMTMRYGWALWNALNYAIRHGLALDRCKQFRMGTLAPISGGQAAGYTLAVGFQIDGYDAFTDPAARHIVGLTDTSQASG